MVELSAIPTSLPRGIPPLVSRSDHAGQLFGPWFWFPPTDPSAPDDRPRGSPCVWVSSSSSSATSSTHPRGLKRPAFGWLGAGSAGQTPLTTARFASPNLQSLATEDHLFPVSSSGQKEGYLFCNSQKRGRHRRWKFSISSGTPSRLLTPVSSGLFRSPPRRPTHPTARGKFSGP